MTLKRKLSATAIQLLLLLPLATHAQPHSSKELSLKSPLKSIELPKQQTQKTSRSGIVELRGGQEATPLTYPTDFSDAALQRSKPYQHLISEAALKWNVEQSLIYAVMHVESYFNPRAVSSAQALGLMQVTQNGAVSEFSRRYLGGRTLENDQVFVPRTNIEIGTAYIHLLSTYYLNQIRSPQTRQLATIAAYNCGLSNLMKHTFDTDSLDYFVYRLNQTSTQEWQKVLTEQFPIAETRNYVTKVLDRKQYYQALIN
ncbi:membrane-bound lytic murein transglycosylase C precursor [Vibrio maritimus]|uniref:Membrane-bound lytic murein transglycosylase C n=1 Tax=Vibrio maritimus TaxID=990268 RepID=A0A090S0K2_9VIBR|nr:membrane-bound lytic murein transglycosylase C precursor [Vibrio maritimus]